MKKFLLSLMALGCMTVAQGQTDVWTATLQHGDEVTVFRMANALVEAITAAEDGDVITLSEGTFNTINITKSITIYGAGYEENDVTGTRLTKINGELRIADGIQDTISSVHIEGCYISGKLFTGRSSWWSASYINSLVVQNCWVNNDLCIYSPVGDVVLTNNVLNGVYGNDAYALTSLLIQNCCLYQFVANFPDLSPVIVDHCVINGGSSGVYYYTNDIFMSTNNSYCLKTGANVKNCLFRFNYNTLLSINAENCYIANSGIFSDIENPNEGYYVMNRTWALQQPDEWVGNDGTPIGPIGGLGWSTTPRIPVINSLELNVQGSQLLINYDAEVRE